MAKAGEKDAKGKGKDAEKEDVEAEEGDAKPKKKKPWLLIAVIALSSIVVLGGAVGATMFFMNRGTHKAPAASVKAKDVAENADAAEEGGDEAADEEDGGDGGEGDKPKPATYVSLEPPFVVNFEGNAPAKFLQINVEVMTRKPEYAEHIKKHMPVIRNNLVLLFGSQTHDKVNTLKGKEELRQNALTEVQKILEEETGDAGIEALYFTSFVMQ